jgi:NAD(P)-dependent dehydrogenase (short-subunit alcohol dehydrogenase family)|tara:strand:- start:87 stop:848 length:762 start_codon:yes stop_codon:yes gene_type:complete
MKEKKQIVAITGGCGRIGSALAEDLLKQGYKVLIGDINENKLIKIKKKLKSRNIEIFSGDLTIKKNIDSFISFGLKKFRKIDSVVCCSYPISKEWGTRFEDLKENFVKEDLYKQLGATIIFCQRIMKYFLKKKKGNLILISSVQGVQTPKFEHYSNLEMNSPIEYSAIKSGIISISKYLSKYYRNRNIRVNCVSPGGIKDKQPDLFVKRYRKSCNLKGLLDGKDISKLILFLISEKSQYINGQNLIIDDGWTL